MDPNLSVPFLTRKMLAFEFAAKFELVVQHQTIYTDPFFVVGATREGTFKFRIDPAGTRVVQTNTFQLTDIPFYVSIVDINSAYGIGDIFANVALRINGDTMQALCSGYFGSTRAVSWPTPAGESSQPFSGKLYTDSFVPPAAGAEISVAVPSHLLWKIKSINFNLVTDVTAVIRTVGLLIDDTVQVGVFAISPNTQALSLTYHYYAHPTAPATPTILGTTLVIPIPPDLIITGSSTIKTQTTNLQAGDQYGTFYITYERYYI